MERYKVLGADLRGFYEPGTRLLTVFHDIERDLQAEQRVVCQYIVNGMTVEEKDELRYAQIPLDQIESLEYLSERAEALRGEVLAGWIGAIPELQAAADALATRLKAGQSAGILKSMHDLVENCHYLVTSLESTLDLTADSDADRARFESLEAQTHRILREAMLSVERQDFVQLALSIEYDLNHHLEEWLQWLKDMGARGHDAARDAARNTTDPMDRTGSSN